MYGGLGKVGLDHGEGEQSKLEVPSFSASAMKFAKKIVNSEDEEEDEELLADCLDDLKEELEKIDEALNEDEE